MRHVGIIKRAAIVGFAAICAARSIAVAGTVLPIDSDWRFQLGDDPAFAQLAFDDAGWRRLAVPHDWSIEGDYAESNPTRGQGAYLPSGVGWYRRTFDVPADWTDRDVSALFEGVYMNSTVYLNGQPVGGRPYGYSSFTCDLSKVIKPGAPNVLAVRVDNSREPSARWYHGCGIYAKVKLIIRDPDAHLIHDGTFITTPSVEDGAAKVRVASELAVKIDATLRVRLIDADGAEVASGETTIVAGQTSAATELDVAKPRRWSPERPTLYRAVIAIVDGQTVRDSIEIPFGVRTVEWTYEDGFKLNGKATKLRGVCNHADAGPFGVAVPDEIWRDRIAQLKAMGCNAIRVSHNPFPPVFYDLCDQMGMMVMDEIFDGWHEKAAEDYGARFFDEWWRRDVTDWVRRDRNHPSVIAWSIGNETGKVDVHGITPFIHAIDPTRKTTGGMMDTGVDVAGWNAPAGTPGFLEKWHAEHPGQPVVITEEPHTVQTRGFYRVATWWRDRGNARFDFPPYGNEPVFYDGHPRYSSSYDNATARMTARTSLYRTKTIPWLAGEFRWSGHDYLGESSFSGGKWPARAWNFGIIDLGGLPKDHYFLYQSQWVDASTRPMIHLLPHWTHPQLTAGTIVPVVAYTNGDAAELFFNGQSLGRKEPRKELLDIVWDVPWAPGELRAVAYRSGRPIAEKNQTTAGDPTTLRLAREPAEATDRVATYTLSALDAHGVLVPWAANQIALRLGGNGTLLLENGDPLDVTNHRRPERRLFYGMARAFVQAEPSLELNDPQLTAIAVLGDRTFQEKATIHVATSSTSVVPDTSDVVRFTTDGSEPTSASPEFEGPITLDATTTVRATLFRNGVAWLTLSETFLKGEEPRVTDPRWEPATKPTSDAFAGPFDAPVLGFWTEGPKRFEFRKNGTFWRVDRELPIHLGWWWYDFPNDLFEAGTATGKGELRWKDSGDVTPLELTTQAGAELKVGERRIFKQAIE